MRKSIWPFIPANDYSDLISLKSFAGMNGRLELRILTQPYSEVFCGYFRRLVFGNSVTKHNFSYSVVVFSSRFPTYRFLAQFSLNNVHKRGLKHHHFISHIPLCFHANPPDFPRLFEPRGKPHRVSPTITCSS